MDIMRKVIPAEDTKRDIPVEAVVVAAAVHRLLLQDAMWEKPAVHITEELLMMEHSLILLMTVENHWNLSAEPVR